MVALPLLALALAPLHALALPRGNVNAGAVGQVPFVPKLGSGSGLSDIDADSSNNNNLVMNSSTPAFASESASEGNLAERYDGHEVWRIDTSRVPAHLREWLIEMMDTNLDIWRVSARTIDVRVSPSLAPGLRAIIPSSASVRTFVSNVQDLVDASSPVPTTEPPEGGWGVESIASPFHDGYHVLEDVYGFGDALAEVFGLRSFEVGTTAEGRAIRAWSASGNTTEPGDGDGGGDGGGDDGDDGGDGDDGSDTTRLEDKYEIVIQAGQHAREWVSTSAALFFLHSLLLDAAADATSPAAKLLKVFTITVIPVVNPDGFAYSHDHSRMWKKNRQEVGGLLCKGIDLNGNWGYQFQPSRLACSDSYKGSYAFEALETRAVANYLANGTTPEGQPRAHRVKAFIDLHSYGQLFMFPFAYSCEDFPADAENLMEAGLGVAKAMRTHGGEGYQSGQACDLTYRSTGDAIDWTYGSGDVRWSYSAELRDTGTYGFMLPPHFIRPTGTEVSAGLRHLAAFIYDTEIGF